MYHLRLAAVGRCKEQWLKQALKEYTTRLRGRMTLDWIECRDDAALIKAVSTSRKLVILDPKGKQRDSEGFSRWLIPTLETSGGHLTLAIGGPEGIPQSLKNKEAISLSSMTLTHQMIRLLLVEQLYRALEIEKGSPYHK